MAGRYRRPRIDIARRARLMLAVIMLLGAIVPIVAIEKHDFRGLEMVVVGHEHKFAWDLFELFDRAGFMDSMFRSILFFLVTPLVGAGVLWLEVTRVRRRPRAIAILVLGAIAAGLLLSVAWSRAGLGQRGFLGLLGFFVMAFIWVGLIIVIRRPREDRGYRIAAVAGTAGLAMSLLPVSPGVHGGYSTALTNLFRVIGEKNGLPLFLLGASGLAVHVAAVLLWSGGNRRKRAGILGVVLLVSLLLAHAIPLWIASTAPSGSIYPVLVAMIAFLTLRFLPALCLVAYGIADLILQKIPTDDELADTFA